MRKIVCDVVFLVIWIHPCLAFTQETLRGVLDIPFGTDIQTVKELILRKPGAKFVQEVRMFKGMKPNELHKLGMKTQGVSLVFTGLYLAGCVVDSCGFGDDFDNLFHNAYFTFRKPSYYVYNHILRSIQEKYGEPTTIPLDEGGVENSWEWIFEFHGTSYKNEIWITTSEKYDFVDLFFRGDGTIAKARHKKELKEF